MMSQCSCTSCKLDDVIAMVTILDGKVNTIMGLVQVESDDLVKLDTDLKAVAVSLAAKINGLALPPGTLAPLLADLDVLNALAAPAVSPPPSP
jgi:hypothetical protein